METQPSTENFYNKDGTWAGSIITYKVDTSDWWLNKEPDFKWLKNENNLDGSREPNATTGGRAA